MSISLNAPKYGTKPEARIAFSDDLLARLRGLPDVQAAAISNLTPFNFPAQLPFEIDGRIAADSTQNPAAVPFVVSPGYFTAMGMRVVKGRAFSEHDRGNAQPVIVVNQTLAQQYFPNEDAIGHRIALGPKGKDQKWYDIVGVTADVMQGAPGPASPPQCYIPWVQLSSSNFFVVIRSKSAPESMISSLRQQVYAIDKDQPVQMIRTLEDWIELALARSRLTLRLLCAFSLIALLIATTGTYAVMAYGVSQRTMEFGIRIALGAGRASLLGNVLFRGMKVAGLGIAIGLLLALALGKIEGAMLFKTSPRDPLTLTIIVGLLLIVSFIACLIPALRATKVDPIVALRHE